MTTELLERKLRHPVDLEADVTDDGGYGRSTRVSDLSIDGCCITGYHRIGSSVELRIHPLGIFQAQVRWAFGGKAGLRFIRRGQADTATKAIIADDRGVAAIEYCVAAALIAIALITALAVLGDRVSTNFNNVDTAVSSGMQYQSG